MDNWINTLLRTLVMFFITFALVKSMGKTNLSKISSFKLITYIVIGIISALISLNLTPNTIFPFISLVAWILLSIALDYLSIKSKLVHDIVYGKETVLVKEGKIMEENLLKVRYTGEELLRELRGKNAFSFADVEFAVMESTGDINILLKSDKKPITPHDLKINVGNLSQPETIILDGTILDNGLVNRGLDRNWLDVQLSNLEVSLENIFIGQIDSSGDLYVDLFDDLIQVPQPKVKELLYSNIEKVYSDLTSYSLETKDPVIKEMYAQNANRMKKILDALEPYLLR